MEPWKVRCFSSVDSVQVLRFISVIHMIPYRVNDHLVYYERIEWQLKKKDENIANDNKIFSLNSILNEMQASKLACASKLIAR